MYIGITNLVLDILKLKNLFVEKIFNHIFLQLIPDDTFTVYYVHNTYQT